MKFIYVLSADVAKDMESAGFVKEDREPFDIGDKHIFAVFINNRESYLSKYQKQYIILSNKLYF